MSIHYEPGDQARPGAVIRAGSDAAEGRSGDHIAVLHHDACFAEVIWRDLPGHAALAVDDSRALGHGLPDGGLIPWDGDAGRLGAADTALDAMGWARSSPWLRERHATVADVTEVPSGGR